MSSRPIARALLLVFALMMATAVSPCGIAMVHGAAVAASAGHASCHHSATPATARGGGPVARKRGCCDPVENHSTACEKICQSLAVLRRPAALPPPERFAAAALPVVVPALARPVVGIDHIPLT